MSIDPISGKDLEVNFEAMADSDPLNETENHAASNAAVDDDPDTVSEEEFIAYAVEKWGMSEEEAEALFNQVDGDGNGTVDEAEWNTFKETDRYQELFGDD